MVYQKQMGGKQSHRVLSNQLVNVTGLNMHVNMNVDLGWTCWRHGSKKGSV